MAKSGYLVDVLILLAAAVFVVSVFHRLRTSPVVGYLVAGVLVGPYALGLLGYDPSVEALAHFGVVFLLFTIGLELPLERLWVMRRLVLGLGLGQVFLTSLAAGGIAVLAGFDIAPAIVVGGSLALSSTAVGLRVLADRGELATQYGRASLSVLLVQDFAVVPLLTLIPLLGASEATLLRALAEAGVTAAVALIGIFLLGRLLFRPLLRLVAAVRSDEVFTATALLIVLGIGWTTYQAGLPMELGAFLAGMLLADTEYRHEIAADVAPFRAILLGLFFVTVGMALDLGLVADRLGLVLLIAASLILAKAVVILALSRLLGLRTVDGLRAGLLLAGGGEFAFVLLSLAGQVRVLPTSAAQLLTAAVALTMIAIPFLAALGARLARRLEARAADRDSHLAEAAETLHDHVLIAGFGRVGQTVGRVLTARGIPWIALDRSPRLIAAHRKQGRSVFYGDAARADVLHAAGAARAQAAVITMDDTGKAHLCVECLRATAPGLKILVRVRDIAQGERLAALGADAVVPETLEASLQLAAAALRETGLSADEVDRLMAGFREDRYAALRDLVPETEGKADH